MTFRRGAKLNPGQVRDMRGTGGGRRSGFPGLGGLGGGGGGGGGGGLGLPVGGGIGGIILLLVIVGVIYFMSGGLGGTESAATNPGAAQPGPVGTGLAHCRTGDDANRYQDCRIVGYVNSIQEYWSDTYTERGERYQQAQTTLFSGSVDTACGQASSETGPFYCPGDQNVYIDLGFFAVLESSYGASSGPLAQAYVMAHEYGHHVQNLEGTLESTRDGDTGPTSNAVRVELQADCFAGVWAANAVDTGYIEPLTQTEIDQALSAASAVGDDRIQQTATGRVTPENWTHGSSEQRVRWFSTGYRSGDPDTCDTFNTNQL